MRCVISCSNLNRHVNERAWSLYERKINKEEVCPKLCLSSTFDAVASPQTSVGARLSKAWRTPTDVCGEALDAVAVGLYSKPCLPRNETILISVRQPEMAIAFSPDFFLPSRTSAGMKVIFTPLFGWSTEDTFKSSSHGTTFSKPYEFRRLAVQNFKHKNRG